MNEKVNYVGRDLEAMAFAVNYHRWILSIFKPYLGNRLVEVGAGTGLFSELLLELCPESLSLVEPSEKMHRFLTERVTHISTTTKTAIYNALFLDVAEQIKLTQAPDSMIYVNVLEHIEDDKTELRASCETLSPGGRCFIFVPALPGLYGKFDRDVGHFRRYRKQELEERVRQAGYAIVKSAYFDIIGAPVWWTQYRLLKASKLRPGSVQLYDQLIVPITRAIETLLSPPIGKNIILIAKKPGAASDSLE